ncbi:Gfo/Idh/MocA family protein [Bradyrhizobium pachyrhizi]|uniref:Gfo/Idh/MocA family protein n=1 Tax=Bradyrhizobium pachyrhizi TaxID=280333 RepID=UPI003D36D619
MKNLAIVGLGNWGQNLVGAVQGGSDIVRFSVGVARRPDALRAFASRWNLRIVDSYGEALSAPDVDGVVLTTPDRMHPQQVIEAARAGKPVLVEKPFALDRKSAELAIDEARKRKNLVAFAHNRRFLPAVTEMRERIAADRIGRILHIEGNFSSSYGRRFKSGMWRADPTETIAGGMTGMGIHQVDLMLMFAGRFARIDARGRRQLIDVPVDDNVSFFAEFEGGATGIFTTLITTSPIWRFRLLGSKGWLEMIGENRLLSCEGNQPVQETIFPIVSTEKMELEAFANAIEGRGTFPVSVEEALHGVAVLEAVSVSIREQRTVEI